MQIEMNKASNRVLVMSSPVSRRILPLPLPLPLCCRMVAAQSWQVL